MYPWLMEPIGASAGAHVAVHGGVQGGVWVERGPWVCKPAQPSSVLGLGWDLHQERFPVLRGGVWGCWVCRTIALVVAVRSCRAWVGCGTGVGVQ